MLPSNLYDYVTTRYLVKGHYGRLYLCLFLFLDVE